VLADDQQCDNKHPDRNRIAQLITARGSLHNDVEKKFEVASLLSPACDFSSRLSGTLKALRCSLVLDGMQPGAVLFFHWCCRNYSAAKVCESQKLALNRLQAFVPSSVSDLGQPTIPDCTPKLVIQLLNVSDLLSETPNLVPKNP
jgi:hypothetical protein